MRLRPWPEGHGWAFVEFARRHGDFAVATASAVIERGAGGKLGRVALALGGVYPVPVRLPEAEKILTDGNALQESIKAATALAGTGDALADPAHQAWYRARWGGGILAT